MGSKIALITGITGMDGSHLADLLLSKNYKVFGIVRDRNNINFINISHIASKINFIQADLLHEETLYSAIEESKPTEIYNLAAQSSVSESFVNPLYTSDVNGLAVTRILDSIRKYTENNLNSPLIKFYQASSSEMYGESDKDSRDHHMFSPRSPYGVAKLYGHWITKNYREAYDMYNVSGILFNHESERRGINFVTRKITYSVAKIQLGLTDVIKLGNIDIKRDWGYAPDYVHAMWLMLQQQKPDDYVVATGKTRSLKYFVQTAFSEIGISNWQDYIEYDKSFLRPHDIDYIDADFSKTRTILGWKPTISFEDIVKRMVQHDVKILKLGY